MSSAFHTELDARRSMEAVALMKRVRELNADLLEAAKTALNYITNTESELGITLDSGDALRAAIRKATGDDA